MQRRSTERTFFEGICCDLWRIENIFWQETFCCEMSVWKKKAKISVWDCKKFYLNQCSDQTLIRIFKLFESITKVAPACWAYFDGVTVFWDLFEEFSGAGPVCYKVWIAILESCPFTCAAHHWNKSDRFRKSQMFSLTKQLLTYGFKTNTWAFLKKKSEEFNNKSF